MVKTLFLIASIAMASEAYSYSCNRSCRKQAKEKNRFGSYINYLKKAACDSWKRNACGDNLPQGPRLKTMVYDFSSNQIQIAIDARFNQNVPITGDITFDNEIDYDNLSKNQNPGAPVFGMGIVIDAETIRFLGKQFFSKHGFFVCHAKQWKDARIAKLEFAPISYPRFCKLAHQHRPDGIYALYARSVQRKACEAWLEIVGKATASPAYECYDVQAAREKLIESVRAQIEALEKELEEENEGYRKTIEREILYEEAAANTAEVFLKRTLRENKEKKERIEELTETIRGFEVYSKDLIASFNRVVIDIDKGYKKVLKASKKRKKAVSELSSELSQISAKLRQLLSPTELNSLEDRLLKAERDLKPIVCENNESKKFLVDALSDYSIAANLIENYENAVDDTSRFINREVLSLPVKIEEFEPQYRKLLDSLNARLDARAITRFDTNRPTSPLSICNSIDRLRQTVSEAKRQNFYENLENDSEALVEKLNKLTKSIENRYFAQTTTQKYLSVLEDYENEIFKAARSGHLNSFLTLANKSKSFFEGQKTQLLNEIKSRNITYDIETYNLRAGIISKKIENLKKRYSRNYRALNVVRKNEFDSRFNQLKLKYNTDSKREVFSRHVVPTISSKIEDKPTEWSLLQDSSLDTLIANDLKLEKGLKMIALFERKETVR